MRLKIRKYITYFYYQSTIGNFILKIPITLYRFIYYWLLSDKFVVKTMYYLRFGKFPNLLSPRTLNEKIQYLKLYNRKSFYRHIADKYAVRKYITDIIGDEYLINIILVIKDLKELNFEALPESFVIKSNQGNGNIILVKNKIEIDEKLILTKCRKWLKEDYYRYSKEWQYKGIQNKIIIEELLLEKNGSLPFDYKFHCFNGKVEIIQVDINRYQDHRRNYYDKNWNLLPFIWTDWQNNKPKCTNGEAVLRPQNIEKMIILAEKLAIGFDLLRVDMYSFNDKIFIGELTLHPGSGFYLFSPSLYDLNYGEKLHLIREF